MKRIPLIGLLLTLCLPAHAYNEAGIYPVSRDHYRYAYPGHWYSPGEFRFSASYVYLDDHRSDNEADGPQIEVNYQVRLTDRLYGRAGASLQRVTDRYENEIDYGHAQLGVGLSETLHHYLNVSIEGGGALAGTRDDAELFADEDDDSDRGAYARLLIRSKLRGPRDLMLEALQVGSDTRLALRVDLNAAIHSGWFIALQVGERRGHDEIAVGLGYHWPD